MKIMRSQSLLVEENDFTLVWIFYTFSYVYNVSHNSFWLIFANVFLFCYLQLLSTISPLLNKNSSV